MLTENPESAMYKRIFSKFNTSLFGTISTTNNDFVTDDGDYESELEQFKNDVLIGPPVEDVIDTGADTVSLGSPSVSPVPSDHGVSISITSSVSHTTAESSQVSNTVNITLPANSEVEETETPPPNPPRKLSRPLPKKTGAKSSKSQPLTSMRMRLFLRQTNGPAERQRPRLRRPLPEF